MMKIVYLFNWVLWKGVDCIRQKVQSVLDQKLAVWEKFCLYHCFSLPEGFHMPNTVSYAPTCPYSQILICFLNKVLNWRCDNHSIAIIDIADNCGLIGPMWPQS